MPSNRRVWTIRDGIRHACELIQSSHGMVYKCGACRRGVVADEPGGLRRSCCLVCWNKVEEATDATR